MNFIKKNWLLILIVLIAFISMSSCTCSFIGGEKAVDAFLNGYVGEGPNPANIIGYPVACCMLVTGYTFFSSCFEGGFGLFFFMCFITLLVA